MNEKTSALSGQQLSPQAIITPPNEINTTIEENPNTSDIVRVFKEVKPTEVRVSLKVA